MKQSIYALSLLFLVSSCGGEDNAPKPAGQPPVDEHAGHDHGPGEHGQGGTASTAAPRDGEAATRAAGQPLVFEIQEGWSEEPPENNMRLAQFSLPAAEGDSADAEVILSYFGPQGAGALDMNITRWCGAFSQPDGSQTRDKMQMSNRRVNGIAVSEYDIRGTYLGMRGGEQNADYRMIVALVESDHGPYYVKLTGPEKTVEKWLASFRSYVGSGCA